MRVIISLFIFFVFSPMTIACESPTDSSCVSIEINHDDGGKTGKRHRNTFLDALAREGCDGYPKDTTSDIKPQLLFNPGPITETGKSLPDYRLIARAKTVDGEFALRGAVLVHASTGIKDLESLKGEWISFVGKKSWPGYLLPKKLLKKAGITENSNQFYFVGNHIGAVSALLHKDVHVAVMAEPLAKRWAEQNDLSIVAVTEAVETGGWWMHQSVSEEQTRICAQALTRLNRSHFKALPAWIGAFVLPVNVN